MIYIMLRYDLDYSQVHETRAFGQVSSSEPLVALTTVVKIGQPGLPVAQGRDRDPAALGASGPHGTPLLYRRSLLLLDQFRRIKEPTSTRRCANVRRPRSGTLSPSAHLNNRGATCGQREGLREGA